MPRSDQSLVYSASARCACGAGLAHSVDARENGEWDCSAILTGRAVREDYMGSIFHSIPKPFSKWKVRREDENDSTRPE